MVPRTVFNDHIVGREPLGCTSRRILVFCVRCAIGHRTLAVAAVSASNVRRGGTRTKTWLAVPRRLCLSQNSRCQSMAFPSAIFPSKFIEVVRCNDLKTWRRGLAVDARGRGERPSVPAAKKGRPGSLKQSSFEQEELSEMLSRQHREVRCHRAVGGGSALRRW